jgi:DSF synthase
MTFVQTIQPEAPENRSRMAGLTAMAPPTSRAEPIVPMQTYENIEVSFDPAMSTYWCHMKLPVKPIVTNELLRDLRHMQDGLEASASDGALPVDYFVFASRTPGVFSLGGDLQYFADCVSTGNRESLHRYARTCIDIVYRNIHAFNLPLITMALVQGDALGGGFETALSFDLVVAERSAKMGLPEILFNLFPGMGAYSLLSRRMDATRAEKMMMSGQIYTAEQLHEMGLVDVLAEDGQGEAAVYDYIQKNAHRRNAHMAIYQARRRVNPVTYEELRDIVDIWTDAVFRLTAADLSKMARLTMAQDRRFRRAPRQAQLAAE